MKATFSELLRARRAELGHNQKQAAEQIGVHAEEVSRWERGDVKAPRTKARGKLANYLRMTPTDLGRLVESEDEITGPGSNGAAHPSQNGATGIGPAALRRRAEAKREVADELDRLADELEGR